MGGELRLAEAAATPGPRTHQQRAEDVRVR
jgi:hypothetical protein